MKLALPDHFPVGRLLHRHAAKVKRDGIDTLAVLHDAESYAMQSMRRVLTDRERCVFRESIRSAYRNARAA